MDRKGSPKVNKQPAFRLVEGQTARRGEEARALQRLAPMAALAMTLSAALALGLALSLHFSLIPTPVDYGAGIFAFALRSALIYGLIPLMTASLAVALFRPRARSVPGQLPDYSFIFAAPVTGLLSGWLVWTGLTLLVSFFPQVSNWIQIPRLWQWGAFYLGRSPLTTVTVLLAAVILPAGPHELLFRGVMAPAYARAESGTMKLVPLVFLAALSSLDPAGSLVFLAASFMAFRVRLASGSLLASSLYTAGFSLSMLLARPLYSGLSRLIFGIPLIDSFKNRLFLVAVFMILLVLLLAPMSIINTAASRQRGFPAAGEKIKDPLFRPVNRVLAWVLSAVLAAFLFFIA